MSIQPKPEKSRRSKKDKARRVALAAIIGGGVGFLCTFLPPQYHLVCASAAKVVGLIIGAQ